MNFDKAQIIDLLTSQGDHDKADQAQAELPDTVDTDQHAGLLDKLGINVDRSGRESSPAVSATSSAASASDPPVRGVGLNRARRSGER